MTCLHHRHEYERNATSAQKKTYNPKMSGPTEVVSGYKG